MIVFVCFSKQIEFLILFLRERKFSVCTFTWNVIACFFSVEIFVMRETVFRRGIDSLLTLSTYCNEANDQTFKWV